MTRSAYANELQNRDALIQHLQQQIQSISTDRGHLQDHNTAAKAALEARLDQLAKERESLQEQWDGLRADLTAKERELGESQDRAKQDVAKHNAQVEELKQALIAAKDTSRALDEELVRARKAGEEAQKRHDQERQQLSTQHTKTHELELQKRDAKIASQSTSLNKYQQTVDDLRDSQKAAAQFAKVRQHKLEEALESARRDLSSARNQLQVSEADRTEQTGTLRERLSQIEAHVKTLESQRVDLTTQLTQAKESATAARRDYDALKGTTEKTLSGLNSELSVTKELLDKEQEARDVILAEHKADRQDYETQLSEVRSLVQKAEERLQSEQNGRQSSEEELKASKVRCAKLEASLAQMESLQAELRAVEKQFQSTTQERNAARQESDQRQSQVQDQTAQIQRHEDHIKDLKSQLASQASEIQRQQAEIQRQQDEVTRQQKEVTRQQEEVARHKQDKDQLDKDLVAWKQRHSDLDTHLVRTKSDLAQRSGELEAAQGRLTASAEEVALWTSRHGEVDAQLAGTKVELAQRTSDLDAARNALDESKIDTAEWKSRHAAVEGQLQSTKEELSQRSDDLSSCQVHLKAAEKDGEEWKARHTDADAALIKTKFTLNERSKELEASQTQLQASEQSLADWKTRHDDLDGQLASVHSQLSQRAEELKSTQTQLGKAHKETEQAKLEAQHYSVAIKQERLQHREKLSQLNEHSTMATKALQVKMAAQTQVIDRLMEAAARSKVNQAAVDEAQRALDQTRSHVIELETACAQAQSRNHDLQRSREACLQATRSLTSALREQGNRAVTMLTKAKARQTKMEHETQVRFKLLKSDVQEQLRQMNQALQQSQETCQKEHLATLQARELLADTQAQLARVRAREGASTVMLAQERHKRQEAVAVVAALSEKFATLNKLVGASSNILTMPSVLPWVDLLWTDISSCR